MTSAWALAPTQPWHWRSVRLVVGLELGMLGAVLPPVRGTPLNSLLAQPCPIWCDPAMTLREVAKSWLKRLSWRSYVWHQPWPWLGVAMVYGVATSWLPAPSDTSFWVSNLSAPYLLLPFLASAAGARSWRGAMALGVLVDWVTVAAFYARSIYDPEVIANNHRRLQPTISADQVLHWAAAQADGPWLRLGIVAGVTFGLLGMWWSRSRSALGAAAIAISFALEPLAWRVYEGRWTVSALLWAAEVTVGAAVPGILLLLAHRGPEVHSPSSA